MSRAGAQTSGLIGPQTPLAAVADLDRAERHAIATGDWLKLGEVLHRQRELWQQLVGATGSPDALAALRCLYRVRQRNHALIAAQADELRQRLLEAQQAQAA